MQPTFTRDVGKILGNGLEYLDSPSLRLDKLTFLGDNSKKQQIDRVCELARNKINAPQPIKGDKNFTLKLGGRMIVNHAGGILENAGICFHKFLNFPMIPGSAAKGIARHYAWSLWKNAKEKNKLDDALQIAENIVRIFGYPTGDVNLNDFIKKEKSSIAKESAGSIVFFPAMPVDDKWQLVPDVLTPHGGNDYSNPIPSFFIAVEKGASFDFSLKKTIRGTDEELKKASDYLLNGLVANGAGAKTVAGYGWFTDQNTADSNAIELMLATPGFLGGASHEQQTDTDLRIPSLRGLLRWWWRTAYRGIIAKEILSKLEAAVWGNTEQSSLISLRLSPVKTAIALFDYKDRFAVRRDFAMAHDISEQKTGLFYMAYGMDEMSRGEKRQRYYAEAGSKWSIEIAVRNHFDSYEIFNHKINAEDIKNQALMALSLLCKFGGVGSKSRNAFGSLNWKDAFQQEKCVGIAQDFCKKLSLDITVNKTAAYSWNTALTMELSLASSDPWAVIDRLGLAVQEFAVTYKHCEEKAVLGLPRKIHGPRDTPMNHQRTETHQRPETLFPDLRDANNGGKTRFASPVWYHLEPVDGKTMQLRITAFPSDMIRKESTSREILSQLLVHLENNLKTVSFNLQKSSMGANNYPSRGEVRSGSINRVSGIKAGDKVQAVLLEEKTKKGGWKANHSELDAGPIQNSGDVPADKNPGDKVELIVAIAKKGEAQFKWPK